MRPAPQFRNCGIDKFLKCDAFEPALLDRSPYTAAKFLRMIRTVILAVRNLHNRIKDHASLVHGCPSHTWRIA